MTQSIKEQIRALSPIEPEFHLFQVGWKMLGGKPVPRSCNASLEQTESGFNSISMNVSHDVDAGTMIDSLVILSASLSHRCDVSHVVISENHVHVLADILADIFRKRTGLCIMSMEEPKIAVPFADADHYLFGIEAMNAALAPAFATNVSNIHFDFAIQHRFIRLSHCVADAVAKIPCGLVRADSKRALNLTCGHAFLGLTKQKRRSKPLFKRQVGVIENRSSGHGELVITVLTVEKMLFGLEFDHGAFTAQAMRALREAQARQELTALSIGRKERVYVH